MVGKVKIFEPLKGRGVITTLFGSELPVKSRNVNMNGVVVLRKNDIVEYELGTDDSGTDEAINVSLVYRPEYAVHLSKLKFTDFGLDVNHNILNSPKCETHDEYCIIKNSSTEELQDSLSRLICESGKYSCGVAVLKQDNSVVIGYSDSESPTEICRFQRFGIIDALKDQQYLAVGELLTNTYGLENYGVMIELDNNFYQTIMD